MTGIMESEVLAGLPVAPLLLLLGAYLREWVEQHRDGREDTWTPDAREGAGSDGGVWR